MLKYVEKNNDFDIFDNATKQYLYSKNPKKWNENASRGIDFGIKNSINLLNPYPYRDNILKDKTAYTDTEILSIATNQQMLRFAKIFKDDIFNNRDKIQRYYNKFIFIGTLLGTHIINIAKKIRALDYLVCEQNLEIFRLSLFVCNYVELNNNSSSITFSIMDDEADFIKKFDIFYKKSIFFNTTYKYFATGYDAENYLNQIINFKFRQDPFLFSYTRTLDSVKKTSLIINSEVFINLDDITSFDFAKANDMPFLLLGAGPSLGNNIEWIKENYSNVVIVAIAATLERLQHHKIAPDIIITIDSDEVIIEQFQNIDQSFIKHSIIIASSITNNNVIKKIKEKNNNLYFYEMFNTFTRSSNVISGNSVSEYSLAILLMMRIKKIYLIGIDFSLNQDTGKIHDEFHHEFLTGTTFDLYSKQTTNKILINNGGFSFREDVISAAGNFYKSVYTTRVLAISSIAMTKIIQIYKSDLTTIYNLSQTGMFIDGTIPLTLDSQKVATEKIDKSFLTNYFGLIFTEFNKQFRCRSDQGPYYNNLIQNIEYIQNSLNHQRSKLFVNFSEFETTVIEFFKMSYEKLYMEKAFIEIITNYYNSSLRFLQYAMNDVSINTQSDKTLTNSINIAWTDILGDILTSYKNIIQQVLTNLE